MVRKGKRADRFVVAQSIALIVPPDRTLGSNETAFERTLTTEVEARGSECFVEWGVKKGAQK